ncbi:MAG: adenosylmethionine--8-amino-7-oxononanoate transaminase, partial [Chloroflexi bacterium]|nr:adenosylmethionine--8-amino-7-oxononanoate transaminase [Chloroflexota bacterium]
MAKQYDSADLERLDKQYVWHPFTQMKDWLNETPLIIASAEGSYLIDVQGRRYLDGVSSLWVTVHGHRRAEIDEAIRQQLDSVAHSTFLGLSHVTAIRLAEKLVNSASPGKRSRGALARVFYSDNGSTAVEVALKMAFQYWQQLDKGRRRKTRFISLVNGYHGDTIGSVSIGGVDLFHQVYRPLLFKTIKANSPYCYRCPWGKTYPACARQGVDRADCVQEMAELMHRHHERVAAIVMEPLIQAAAGMLVMPPGYTSSVRELAASHNILFIADEVATGFGRTGAFFACHREDVRPDLMATAKGITGGYLPLAATLTTEEVFNAFCAGYNEKKTFFHGHTYTANPLACAAALANLEIFRREKTLHRLQGKTAYLTESLRRFWQLKHVGDIRQLGFMVGIELVRDPDTKEAYPYEDKIGIRVIREARKRGVIIRP